MGHLAMCLGHAPGAWPSPCLVENVQALHEFGKRILVEAYRGTVGVAHLNRVRTGNPSVYLTLLGGGAFGNNFDNIMEAMVNGMASVVSKNGLDINIVCYDSYTKKRVDSFLEEYMLPKYLDL